MTDGQPTLITVTSGRQWRPVALQTDRHTSDGQGRVLLRLHAPRTAVVPSYGSPNASSSQRKLLRVNGKAVHMSDLFLSKLGIVKHS